MKTYNTRFNPTTNGNLHLGHIYLAMVNYTMAKRSGGKFILRFDDDQEVWGYRQTIEESNIIADQMKADLELFGIVPDGILSQRANNSLMMDILHDFNDGEILETSYVWSDNSPEVVGNDISYCAYNYPMTAEKVAWDFMSEINLLIRGEDLITEACLYSAICEKWRLPQIRQVYLPRLLNTDGKELSKTGGFPTIVEMVQSGVDVDEMVSLLQFSCLKSPLEGWVLENILMQPKLVTPVEIS